MRAFDYILSYGNSTLNLHFFFNTERELLTSWDPSGDPYHVSVKCTGGNGTTYTTDSTAHSWSFNHSIFTATATPNNSTNVYGCYFTQDTRQSFPFHIGIDPNSEGGAGFIQIPSKGCTVGNYDYLPPNEYVYTYDGQSHSGSFNTTQGLLSWEMFVKEILNKVTTGVGVDYSEGDFDIFVDTNIPIFDTYQHFRAYIDDGSTEGLLNGYAAPSEDEIGKYYINNLVSNNGNISDILNNYYYKFDGVNNCLGFASDDGVHATLYSFYGGPSTIWKSEDKGQSYDEVGSFPTSYYMRADLSVPAYVLTFNTNIPTFVSDDTDSGIDKLNSFISGNPAPSGRTYTGDDAWNRSSLDGVDIVGKIGDIVDQTINGVSSIAFTHGVQMFDLTATQKATFLRDILSEAEMEDVLAGTKLFGANQMNALQSLRYMPIDADEVCSVQSASSCQIGSYTYNFSSAVSQILQNNKMINMGEQFFASPYEDGDFRNLEPWCKLYVILPYAGTHALQISKYINKRVGIKLAVDITTGACEYHLYANGCEMDTFQGMMGSEIPLTANDKASQVSAIRNGILTAVDGIGQIEQNISGAATAATGIGSPNTGGMGGGPTGSTRSAIHGAATMLESAQSFINAPISTKGASTGNLGDFGVTSPYFVFAWANSITPANEINLVGKPSNQGDKVGRFAGYLKCSAFRLANGFTGTTAEAEEIVAQMLEGIYIS